jgi:hypothetical protein
MKCELLFGLYKNENQLFNLFFSLLSTLPSSFIFLIMLAARTRLSSVLVSKRTLATVAAEIPKKQPDQKFKVVVVGGGPGGLSGEYKLSFFECFCLLILFIHNSFVNCFQATW